MNDIDTMQFPFAAQAADEDDDSEARHAASANRRHFLGYAAAAVLGGGIARVSSRTTTAAPVVPAAAPEPVAAVDSTSFFTQAFRSVSDEIYRRHWLQTRETVATLRARYAEPVFGEIDTLRCFEQLSLCVDPTDITLYNTNQLVHTLQVLEGMEQDGIDDPDMLFAAVSHDLGKVLMLTGEQAENVVCYNTPIGDYEPGVGLDNVVFQWNHDEFVYERLKTYLPDQVAWLIRYHSIDYDLAAPLMDARDRHYLETYLKTFRKYDQGTKSTTHLPAKNIRDYENLILDYLPRRLTV